MSQWFYFRFSRNVSRWNIKNNPNMLFTLWFPGATSAPAPPAAYLGWNLGTFTPGDAYQVPDDAPVVEEQDFAAKQAPEMMSFNRYIKEVSSPYI